MRRIVLISIMFVMASSSVFAEETKIYQTLPGTSIRDYSKPGMVIDDDGRGTKTIYKTIPGVDVRDFGESGLIIEDQGDGSSQVYRTLPGMDVRDYSKPGYVIENEE